MELKELLKEARKQTGMTQKQFAAYFRIPYRTLEDWERGVRHIAEYLLRLMILSFGNGRFGKRTSEKARLMLEVNTMPLPNRPFRYSYLAKYTMTIEEAAAYFHIGRSRIRAIVAEKSICTICFNGWKSCSDKEKTI